MVRPITNWWPMIRIAWRTARRITGSPTRPDQAQLERAADVALVVSSASVTSWPVSIRPQVRGVDAAPSRCLPRCCFQSASPELVADQLVGGVLVGNAQQRFGHAHQQHAFLAAEVVLAHEGFDRRPWSARGAHAA